MFHLLHTASEMVVLDTLFFGLWVSEKRSFISDSENAVSDLVESDFYWAKEEIMGG